MKSFRLLLRAGASVDATDKQGNSALMWSNDADAARVLLTAGADQNRRNAAGDTALMKTPRADVARALIEGGADISAKDNLGKTALEMAVKNGDYCKAQVLKASRLARNR